MLSIELAVTATLALGMLLVLLPGMIDLSVGSGVGLIGGIASVLVFEHQIPAPLAMGFGFAFANILQNTPLHGNTMVAVLPEMKVRNNTAS